MESMFQQQKIIEKKLAAKHCNHKPCDHVCVPKDDIVKICEDKITAAKQPIIYVKLDAGVLGGNGQYWQWNNVVSMSPTHFNRTTTNQANDTIVILQVIVMR